MPLYWIEHAPNPWVRAVAIIIIGTIAYFYRDDGAPQEQWLGGWGVCNSYSDEYDHWY